MTSGRFKKSDRYIFSSPRKGETDDLLGTSALSSFRAFGLSNFTRPSGLATRVGYYVLCIMRTATERATQGWLV